MKTRIVLVVATFAALAFAGAASVRGAEPTLGASVESVNYIDENGGRELIVLSRSTVEVEVIFEPTGGWRVEPASLVLAPGEQASVRVIGDGQDGATVAVRIAGTAPVPDGAQRGEIELVSRLYLERPLDPWPWVIGVVLTLLVSLVVGIAAGRLLRRSRLALEERGRWLARIS